MPSCRQLLRGNNLWGVAPSDNETVEASRGTGTISWPPPSLDFVGFEPVEIEGVRLSGPQSRAPIELPRETDRVTLKLGGTTGTPYDPEGNESDRSMKTSVTN